MTESLQAEMCGGLEEISKMLFAMIRNLEKDIN
jgi:hypothetical protein